MGRDSIGELEHLILLAIMGRADGMAASTVRETLESEGRGLTRGALYRSLDRLGEKGLLHWSVDEPEDARGGHPRRIYRVTTEGRSVVADRRATLERLWTRVRESGLGLSRGDA